MPGKFKAVGVKMPAASRTNAVRASLSGTPLVSKPYKIRTAVCESGERMPLLVEATIGLPMVTANQYVLRARHPSCDVAAIGTRG